MKNVVYIPKWDYQKSRSNFSSKLDISCCYNLYNEVDNLNEFDNLNGLLYLNSTTEEYKFKIIDSKKWFLAKIKYGF